MKKVPFIEQMEHSECGMACLAMVFNYYGHHINLTELREEFGIPRGGLNFSQISQIANMKNMSTRGLRIDDSDFTQIKLPAILYWNEKHFVILEKISKNTFHIVDPAIGKIKLKREDFIKSYSNVLLELYPNEDFEKKKKVNSYRFFWQYILKHPKFLICILVSSILLQVLGIILPLLTKYITDNILIPGKVNTLNIVGIGIICILVSYQVTIFLRGYLIAKLQTAIDKDMMVNFIDHMFNLPFKFFENRSSGDLLFRANSNTFIRQILSTKIISFIIDFFLIFSYTFLMFRFSIYLSCIVLAIGVFMSMFLIFSTRITYALSSKDVINHSKVQQILSESINGIADIKMMGVEQNLHTEWKSSFLNQLKSSERANIWSTLLNVIPSSVQFGLPLFLLWSGGYLVLQGDLTLGTLIAFNSLALSFISPIVSLGTGYTELITLGSYVQRIQDVMTSDPEQRNVNKEDPHLKGKVTFENVSFKYNYFGDNVLSNISFSINPGEKVAIVGTSGSGKSTITKLLLGLYKPNVGRILLDDYDIESLDIKKIRKQIGTVSQEAKLFHKTILDNIIIGKKGLNETDVLIATERANILADISSSPLGLQTTISEKGVNFSGGQRQRLALARAIVHSPPILLLDEATSALDNISEKKIEESISSLSCTRIIIAHRLSTIKDADRILVLHKGMIVEEGTHDHLINKNGHYADLYTAQKKQTTEMNV